jgi:hypothetical protein
MKRFGFISTAVIAVIPRNRRSSSRAGSQNAKQDHPEQQQKRPT